MTDKEQQSIIEKISFAQAKLGVSGATAEEKEEIKILLNQIQTDISQLEVEATACA